MNERIRELAKQAGWGATSDPYARQAFDVNMFAELLVQKFDNILILEELDCVGNKDKRAEKRVQRLREKVKTYFGVEE